MPSGQRPCSIHRRQVFLDWIASRTAYIYRDEACSHKDDWESLCYIIVDLFTNGAYFQLPKSLSSTKKAEAYFSRKNEINPMDLKSVPVEYINFFMYIRNLAPEQEPLLEHWKRQFRNYFLAEEIKLPYCWVPRKHSSSLSSSELSNDRNAHEIIMEIVHEEPCSSDDLFESSHELGNDEETLTEKLSRVQPPSVNLGLER